MYIYTYIHIHIYAYIHIYISGPLDSRILSPLSKRLILLIIFLYKSLFPGLGAPWPRFRDLGKSLTSRDP